MSRNKAGKKTGRALKNTELQKQLKWRKRQRAANRAEQEARKK
jgi:hypothetical protein